MKHILVIDDDERLRNLLKRFLQSQGFQVSASPDAASAEKLMRSLSFNLLVVDVMMPGEDGISFVRRMRVNNAVPVIMLTAKSEVEDRISGFEAGIDDFLSKPFEPKELVMRIEAILRRTDATSTTAEGIRAFGSFLFDLTSGRLSKNDDKIDLTRNERDILSTLAQNIGETLSREKLLEVLGEESQARNVDVIITRLRKKIETDPKKPEFLTTERGKGYKLLPKI